MVNVVEVLPIISAFERERTLVDSLRLQFGEPDSIYDLSKTWVRGKTAVGVSLDDVGMRENELRVFTGYRGPEFWSATEALVDILVMRALDEQISWARERFDADRWSVIVREDSTVISYDRTRVERPSAGTIRLWTRWDFRSNRQTTDYPRRSYNAALAQWEIRCSDERHRVGPFLFYLDRALSDSQTSKSWTAWDETIPGSIGESLVRSVCEAFRPARRPH
jgi:hypothetical protein